jgi:hypothetical protein
MSSDVAGLFTLSSVHDWQSRRWGGELRPKKATKIVTRYAIGRPPSSVTIVVLYAFWVGRVGHPATMDEMMPIVYILSLSGFSALGARLISIVAMPEPKQR